MSGRINYDKVASGNPEATVLDPTTNLPDGGVSANIPKGRVSTESIDKALRYKNINPAVGTGTRTLNPEEYDFQLKNATDNRELRAQDQGATSIAMNAVGRLVGTTATKVLQSAALLGGGVVALGGAPFGLTDMNTMTNNFFTIAIQNIEDSLKESMPIYKTNKYLEGNIWEQMTTSGFWADDVVDGAAFALSAYVTGAGYLGVASKAGGYSKIARAFQAQSYAAKTGKIMSNGLKLTPKLAKLVRAADFVTMSSIQTISEAAFEAKDMGNQIYESFMPQIESGRMTAAEAHTRATEASKNVFKANVGVLMPSNMLFNSMVFDRFRGFFKMGKKTNLNWKDLAKRKATHLADPTKPMEALKPLTKLKLSGQIAKYSLISMASEGLFEENVQTSIQNYFSDKAKGADQDTEFWESVKNISMGMVDNLSDTDGLKSIFLGAIIGIGPGGYSGWKGARQGHAQQMKLERLLTGGTTTVEDDISRYLRTEDEVDENGKKTGKKKLFLNQNGEYEYDAAKVDKLLTEEFDSQKELVNMLRAINSGNTLMANFISDRAASAKVFQLANAGYTMEDIQNWFEFKTKETEEVYKNNGNEDLIPQLKEDTKHYAKQVKDWYKLYESITNNHAGLFNFGNSDAAKELKGKAIAAQFAEGVFQNYWREQKKTIKDELKLLSNDIYNKIFNLNNETETTEEGQEQGLPRTKDFKGDEYTKANLEEAKQWLIDRFGEDTGMRVHKGLIKDRDGKEHFAKTLQDVFLLSDAMEEGSEYHEAFHRVSIDFLTESERARLYNSAKKAYKKETAGMTSVEMEEFLAEKFRTFVMDKNSEIEPSTKGEVKNIFQTMWEFLTRVFKSSEAIALEDVETLFESIESGKYKDFQAKQRNKNIAEKREALKKRDGEIDAILNDSYEKMKALSDPNNPQYKNTLESIEEKHKVIKEAVEKSKRKREDEDGKDTDPTTIHKADGSTAEVTTFTSEDAKANGYEIDSAQSKVESQLAKSKRKVYVKEIDSSKKHYIVVDPNKKENNINKDVLTIEENLLAFANAESAIKSRLENKEEITQEFRDSLKTLDGTIKLHFENGKLAKIIFENSLGDVETYTGSALPTKPDGTKFTSKEIDITLRNILSSMPQLQPFLVEGNIDTMINTITEEYKASVMGETELAEVRNKIIEKYWKDSSYDDATVADIFANDTNFVIGFYGGRHGGFELINGELYFNPYSESLNAFDEKAKELVPTKDNSTLKDLNISISKDSPVDMEIWEDGRTIELYGETFKIQHKDPASAIVEDGEGNPKEVILYQNGKKVVIRNPLIVNKIAVGILLNQMAIDIVFDELLNVEEAGFVKITLGNTIYNVYRENGLFDVYDSATDKKVNYKSKEFANVLSEMNRISNSIVASLIRRDIYSFNPEQNKELLNEIRRINTILTFPTAEETLAAVDAEEVRRTQKDEEPQGTFEEGESLEKLNSRIHDIEKDIHLGELEIADLIAQAEGITSKKELAIAIKDIEKVEERVKQLEADLSSLKSSLSKDIEVDYRVQETALKEALKATEEQILALESYLATEGANKEGIATILNDKLSKARKSREATNTKLAEVKNALKPVEERILNKLATQLSLLKKMGEQLGAIHAELSTREFDIEVEVNTLGKKVIDFNERGVITPQNAVGYVYFDEQRQRYIVRNREFENTLINAFKVTKDIAIPTIDFGDREDSSEEVKKWWRSHPQLLTAFKSGKFGLADINKLVEDSKAATEFDAEIDNIPIRIEYVFKNGESYTSDLYYHISSYRPGMPKNLVLKYGEPGFEKESEEFRVGTSFAIRNTRLSILEAYIEGKTLSLEVKERTIGHLNNTGIQQSLHDLLIKLSPTSDLTAVTIKVATVNGSEEMDLDDFHIQTAMPGNVFWLTKHTVTRDTIAVKLNPKKISRKHAQIVLRMFKLAHTKSPIVEKGMKGDVRPQRLLDLLVNNGKKATSIIQKNINLSEYLESKQLYLENGTLYFGTDSVDITSMSAEEEETFLNWITTNKNYAISNKNFRSETINPLFKGAFKILDIQFDPATDNYTSFIIKNGFLNTDVDVYEGTSSITKNPAILYKPVHTLLGVKIPRGYLTGNTVTAFRTNEEIPESLAEKLEEYHKNKKESKKKEEEEKNTTKAVIIKRLKKFRRAAATNENLEHTGNIYNLPEGTILSSRIEYEGKPAIFEPFGIIRKDENGNSYIEFKTSGKDTVTQNIITAFKKVGFDTAKDLNYLTNKNNDVLMYTAFVSYSHKPLTSEEVVKVTLTDAADIENRKTIMGLFAGTKEILNDSKFPSTQEEADSILDIFKEIQSIKGFSKLLSYVEVGRIKELNTYIKKNFGRDTEEGEGVTETPPPTPPVEDLNTGTTAENITDEEWDKLSHPEMLKLDKKRYAKFLIDTNYRPPKRNKLGGFFKEYKGNKYVQGKIDEAVEWLAKTLGKDTAVRVVEGLIKVKGNRLVFGQMKRDAILLSTLMEEGTEYHEAFHRVSLLYLTEKERNSIYAQARKENKELRKVSNEEVEEYLAEKFREYVMRKNAALSTSGFKGKIKNSFKVLWGIVNRFFKRFKGVTQYDQETLFRAIEAGRFRNSKIAVDSTFTSDRVINRAFKTGDTELHYVEDERQLDDVVTVLFKSLVDSSLSEEGIKLSNIKAVESLNYGKLFNYVENVVSSLTVEIAPMEVMLDILREDPTNKTSLEYVKNTVLDNPTLEDSKVLEELETYYSMSLNKIGLLQEILQNKKFYSEELDKFLNSLGIVSNRDSLNITDNGAQEIDEDTGDELSNMSTWNDVMFKYNAKENVAANIKLLLATLSPTKEVSSTTGLASFVSYSDMYNRVMYDLNKHADTAEEMMRIIESKASTDIGYANLYEQLSNDQTLQTQFRVEVNKNINTFIKVILDKTEDSFEEGYSVKFRYLDSKLYTATATKLREWSNAFILTSTIFSKVKGKKSKPIVDRYDKLVNRFNTVAGTASKEYAKDKVIEDLNIKKDQVRGVLASIGIQIKSDELDNTISFLDADPSIGFMKFIHIVNPIFSPKGNLRTFVESPKELKDKKIYENNLFSKSPSIKKLADLISTSNSEALGYSIKGPKGNNYYAVSQHTYQSNVLNKLKSRNSTLLNNRLLAVYNEGSKILKRLKSDPEFAERFGIRTLSALAIGENDYGREFQEVTEIEEYLLRLDSLQKGLIMFPTPADRKFTSFFEGLDLIKSSLDPNGKVSLETAEQFVDYLDDELNRVKLTKKQVNDVISGNAGLLVEDIHYIFLPTGHKVVKGEVVISTQGNVYKEGAVLKTPGKLVKKNNRFVGNGAKLTHFKGYKKGEDKAIFIQRILQDRLNEELQTAHDLGIIAILKDDNGNIIQVQNRIIDKDTITKYKSEEFANTELESGAITLLILDNLSNTVFASIEMFKLFIGDPAAYLNSETLLKRVPLLTSTGDNTRNDFPADYFAEDEIVHSNTYNTITVDDVFFKSKYYEELVESHADHYMAAGIFKKKSDAIKQAKLKLNDYTKNNRTDGQTFVTPEMYKAILVKMGKFTDEVEAAYKIMMDENLTPSEEDMKKTVGVFMQPLKMLYLNTSTVGQQSYSIIDKMSIAVLFPKVIKGTQLESIYKDMLKNNIHQLKFKSAQKVGATEVGDFHINNDTNTLTDLSTIGKVEQDFDYLRFQLDTSPHNKSLNLVGTQFKKIGFSNVSLNKRYSNGELGSDIVKRIHATHNALSDLGVDDVKVELGLSDDLSIKDKDALMRRLRREAKKANMSNQEIESFKLDENGDFYLQLDSRPGNRKWIQSRVLSIIKRSTIDLNLPGGMFIQMSDIGNKSLLYDNTLEFKPEEGYMEADVSISMFKDVIPGYKAKTHEQRVAWLADNPEHTAMAYRIPTEGQNSIYTVRIREFLRAEIGDVVVLPGEGPTLGGFDFDIDKLYFIRPHYTTKGFKVKFLDKSNSAIEDRYVKWVRSKASKEVLDLISDIKTSDVERIKEKYKNLNSPAAEAYREVKERAAKSKDLLASELKGVSEEFKNSAAGIEINTTFLEGKEAFKGLSQQVKDIFYSKEEELGIRELKGIAKQEAYLRLTVSLLQSTFTSAADKIVLSVIELNNEEILELLGQRDITIDAVKKSAIAEYVENKAKDYEEYNEKYSGLKDENYIERNEELRKLDVDATALVAEDLGLPTLAEFEEYSIEEQNTRRALENRLIEDYITIHTDKLQKAFTEQPLDYGAKQLALLSDEIAELEGAVTKFSDNALGTLTPSFQMDVKSKYGLGGNLAKYALANAHFILGQKEELSLSVYLGVGNSKVIKDKTVTDLSSIYEEEGTSMDGTTTKNPITESYTALMGGHVDLAAKPFITHLNLTDYTANVTSLLVRAGVGLNTFRFLSQPILKEVSKLAPYEGAKIGRAVEDPITEIQDIYATKLILALAGTENTEAYILLKIIESDVPLTEGEMEKLFNAEMFMKDIKVTPTRDTNVEYLIRQLKVLQAYKTFNNEAEKLKNAVLTSRLDTKKYGNSVTQLLLFLEKLNEAKHQEAVGTGITNYSNLYKNTLLKGHLENGIELSLEVLKRMVIEGTPAYRSLVVSMLRNTGKFSRLSDVKVNSVSRDIHSTIFGEFFAKHYRDSNGNPLDKKAYARMLSGDNSTSSKVFKIKSGTLLPGLQNNALIEALEPDFSDVNTPHSMKIRKGDDLDNAKLQRAWETMYFSEVEGEHKFALELFEFSYITSGFANNTYSFFDLIPDALLRDTGYNVFIDKTLTDFQDATAGMYVTDEVYLNSWDNDVLVPKIEFGRNKYSGISQSVLNGAVLTTRSLAYDLGINSNNKRVFKPYVKTVTRGKVRLYKFAGIAKFVEGNGTVEEAVYYEVNKKGYRQGPVYVKEYWLKDTMFGSNKAMPGEENAVLKSYLNDANISSLLLGKDTDGNPLVNDIIGFEAVIENERNVDRLLTIKKEEAKKAAELAGTDSSIDPIKNPVQPTVNADSYAEGLEFAITNPIITSPRGGKWRGRTFTESQLKIQKYFENGIWHEGKRYDDTEEAYQKIVKVEGTNNRTLKPEFVDNGKPNYQKLHKVMVSIIEAKLTQYPGLTLEIGKKGGMQYLNTLRHQPTKGTSYWESNGKDGFLKAFKEAWGSVTATDPTKYTVMSGGATGADTVWGQIAKKFGLTNIVHWFIKGDAKLPPARNTELKDKAVIEEGKTMVKHAMKAMFGRAPSNVKNELLIRDWAQVKYSDAVFAVATIGKEGDIWKYDKKSNSPRKLAKEVVQGGTGYAVEMAIQIGKPVHVYQQEDTENFSKGWYTWDGNKFISEETPILTTNFAGIGSQNINADGRKAIEDVFAKSFKGLEVNTTINNVSVNKIVDSYMSTAGHSYSESSFLEDSIENNDNLDFTPEFREQLLVAYGKRLVKEYSEDNYNKYIKTVEFEEDGYTDQGVNKGSIFYYWKDRREYGKKILSKYKDTGTTIKPTVKIIPSKEILDAHKGGFENIDTLLAAYRQDSATELSRDLLDIEETPNKLTQVERQVIDAAIEQGKEFKIIDLVDDVVIVEYLNAKGARYTIYYKGSEMSAMKDIASTKPKKAEELFVESSGVVKASVAELEKLHNNGEALYTMRVTKETEDKLKGLTAKNNFGNIFTGSGFSSLIGIGKNDGSKGAVEAASIAYKEWLLDGTYPDNVTSAQRAMGDAKREWILNRIESGKLDNVQLGYMNRVIDGGFYYSHANALKEVIEFSKKARAEKKRLKDLNNQPEDNSKKITTKDKPLEVYTDGSRIQGTDTMGYGIAFKHGDNYYSKSVVVDPEGYRKQYGVTISNPTMEILAVKEAIEAFAGKGEHLVISTDFKVAVGWVSTPKSRKKSYIKDIGAEIDNLIKATEDAGGSVKIKWVKGHTGIRGNELADAAAKDRNEYDTLQDVYEDNKGGKKVGEETDTTVTNNVFTFKNGVQIETGKIKVNEEQEAALHAMDDFVHGNLSTMSLIGYAGTGKTTVISIFNEYLKKLRKGVEFSSPTHRANNVMRKKGVTNINTIHAMLGLKLNLDLEEYSANDPKFTSGNEPKMGRNSIVIIDESSMINDDLFAGITSLANTMNTKIMYVGDGGQLSPVKSDHDSKALTSTDTQVYLTTVMRTGNNPLLKESMDIRDPSKNGDFSYVSGQNEKGEGITFTTNSSDFLDSFVKLLKSDSFKNNVELARIVTGTNPSVDKINAAVRERLWGPRSVNDFNKGELLMGYQNITDYQTEESIVRNGIDYIVTTAVPYIKTITGLEVKGTIVGYEREEMRNGELVKVPMEQFIISPTLNDPKVLNSLSLFLADSLAKANKAPFGSRARGQLFRKYFSITEEFLTMQDMRDPRTNKVFKKADIKYGYAQTIHKSQGGTYTFTFVNGGSLGSFTNSVQRQLRYVAITRSEKHTVVLTNKGDTNTVDLEKSASQYYTPLDNLAREGEELKEECGGGKGTKSKGTPKAKHGYKTSFTPGSKWGIVKDLKGMPSHAKGGVQLSIGKNGGVHFTNGDSVIHAEKGLVLPNEPEGDTTTVDEPVKPTMPSDEEFLQSSTTSSNTYLPTITNLKQYQACNTNDCAEYATTTAANLYGVPRNEVDGQMAASSWYRKDRMEKAGGQTIWEKGKDMDYNVFQIGDQVMLSNGLPSWKANRDPAISDQGWVKNPLDRHAGTIIGKNPENVPMIRHNIAGRYYEEPINNIHKKYSYFPSSVVRTAKASEYMEGMKKSIIGKAKREWIDNNYDPSLNFELTGEAGKDIVKEYEGVRKKLALTFGIDPSKLDGIIENLIGISAQESNVDNTMEDDFLSKAKQTATDMLPGFVNTAVKKGRNVLGGIADKILESTYDVPTTSDTPQWKRQIEIDKLVKKGLPKEIALERVTKKYGIPSNVSTVYGKSKGPWKQKEAAKSYRLVKSPASDPDSKSWRIGWDRNTSTYLQNAVSLYMDNVENLKELYPNESDEFIQDAAIISWAAPAKAKSKEFMDYFYRGIGNPRGGMDVDYLKNVAKYKSKLIKEKK